MHYKDLIASLIFCCLCFLSSPEANSQVTAKKNFLIGGTLGFSSSSSNVDLSGGDVNFSGRDSRATQFNITPSMGYFIVDNLALGIGLDYTLNKVEEPVDITDPQSSLDEEFDSDLLFGPFTRLYLPVGQDKAFFFQADFGFGSAIDEIVIQGETQTTSTNVFAVGIGPGFTIFSNDAIGIEALVKYNYARSESDLALLGQNRETITTTNQIDFSVGLQIYLAGMRPAGADGYDGDPDDEEGSRFY